MCWWETLLRYLTYFWNKVHVWNSDMFDLWSGMVQGTWNMGLGTRGVVQGTWWKEYGTRKVAQRLKLFDIYQT